MDMLEETQQHPADFIAVNARPPSTSYIPRPVSGTSRRSSSTLFSSISKKEAALQAASIPPLPQHIRRSSQLPHKTCRTNDGMPPTSFSDPRASHSRSDSSTAHGIPAHLGWAWMQSQPASREPLPAKPGSIVVSTPISAFHNTVQRTSLPSSGKKREITPRTLMKPIQPSLPRSQTIGHLCYPSVAKSTSPSKPSRLSSLGPVLSQDSRSKPRTSDTTIRVDPKQSEKKCTTKAGWLEIKDDEQLQQKTKLLASNAQPSFLAENVPRSECTDCSITLNLSVNDVVNTQRLEEQRRRLSTKRPLFVNTTLANTLNTYDSSPLTLSAPLSGTTYGTSSSSGISPDPRNVYSCEGIAYWTGRYVSTTDLMRQRDCNSLLKSREGTEAKVSINSSEFEARFDQLEASRQSRVFEELQLFCRTESARKSLSNFESQLKKKDRKPSLFVRSYSELFTKPVQSTQPKSVAPDQGVTVRHCSGYNATNQTSALTAQAAIEKLSGIVTKRGGLTKSKTTGNLALKSVATRAPTPGSLPVSHLNTQLDPLSTNNIGGVSKCIKPVKGIVTSRREWPLHSLSEFSPASLNHGQGNRSEPKVIKNTFAPEKQTEAPYGIDTLDTSTHDNIKETIVHRPKSRNQQSSGQSSGEFVKRVVGASIREVRKMSRKVGSMGWSSSSDDLPGNSRTVL